jgi:hypothetical protein
MRGFSARLVGSVALVWGVSATVLATAPARLDQVRTVYLSAFDSKGAPVSDLTAADLSIKEGGKDRAITSLEPATAPMHVAILIDDGGSGVFQPAVLQFLQATVGHAQFSISLMNPQPTRILDYTGDVEPLRAAVGKLGQRGRIQSGGGEQIIEAVSETAKELRQREARRPVIIVLTTVGETALSERADEAIGNLKNSAAALSVIHTAGLGLGAVLGDGPKQSGGLIEQVADGVMIGQALSRVASNLMHQYVVTYTLPEGVKANEKLAVSTSRKGIKIIAPSKIPDR